MRRFMFGGFILLITLIVWSCSPTPTTQEPTTPANVLEQFNEAPQTSELAEELPTEETPESPSEVMGFEPDFSEEELNQFLSEIQKLTFNYEITQDAGGTEVTKVTYQNNTRFPITDFQGDILIDNEQSEYIYFPVTTFPGETSANSWLSFSLVDDPARVTDNQIFITLIDEKEREVLVNYRPKIEDIEANLYRYQPAEIDVSNLVPELYISDNPWGPGLAAVVTNTTEHPITHYSIRILDKTTGNTFDLLSTNVTLPGETTPQIDAYGGSPTDLSQLEVVRIHVSFKTDDDEISIEYDPRLKRSTQY